MIPTPDPAWDYAAPYHELWAIKEATENAIAAISQIEEASPESDRQMREALEQIEIHLNSAKSFLGVRDE